jgi:predicted GNAT family acetyltransferase
MKIRVLTEGDRDATEALLARHCDTSMFLRSNIRQCGFEYSGQPRSATYAAVFDRERIDAVAAHCWNGMVLVQAPVHAEELAEALVQLSGRAVTGFSGPRDQVSRVRAALGLADARAQSDDDETLYALPLIALSEPALGSEPVVCRSALRQDRDVLVAWRLAYELEVLGASDVEDTRRQSEQFMDTQLRAGQAWVATVAERLVSLSALNAALPDIVQLGGIYTPPEFRGRGYAKRAVAAQLLAARASGVTRAVLFTNNPSAVRCYEALGFRRTGELSLVLLQ